MSVDIYVVMRNNSELGDITLRNFWLAALKVFKEYGIEVYVMPLVSPGTSNGGNGVFVVINGFEVPVRTLLTVDEAVDMILKYISIEKDKEEDIYALGIYVDRDDKLENAVLI